MTIGLVGVTVDFKLTQPTGGSAGALRVLVATNPASNPFATLSAGAVSAGNPIPAGTSGVVTITLPKTQALFLRRQAIEPSGERSCPAQASSAHTSSARASVGAGCNSASITSAAL